MDQIEVKNQKDLKERELLQTFTVIPLHLIGTNCYRTMSMLHFLAVFHKALQ